MAFLVVFFHLPELCKHYGLRNIVLNVHSVNISQSYGMTPYEDSDAKDFEILERQREIRRRCKLIPSWAQ